MSIQALRERLTTVTWRPTCRELEAALAEIAALESRLAEATNQIAALTYAAHMPPDYPYGLPSWINQRLYRMYIEQGENQEQWDALTQALDARDAAEARESRLRAALTRIRDERGVKPYDVAREALRLDAEQPAKSERDYAEI